MNNYQMNDNNIIKLILLILLIIILLFFKNTSKFTKFTNFTSFYSEGPPNDEALDLSDCVPEILKEATSHFNKITFYTPKILRDTGYGKYVKEHKLYPLAKQWSPVEKIGLFAFKPTILLIELDKMKDGEILVFREINWKKYANYNNFDGYPEIAERVLNDCKFDFFINFGWPGQELKKHCKAKVIRELGGENTEFVKNMVSFHTYLCIMKKSSITIELITEWQKACENDSWLNADISDDPDQPGLVNHVSEQSLFSVILAKWIYKRKYNIPLRYPIVKLSQEKNEIFNLDDQYFEHLKYF